IDILAERNLAAMYAENFFAATHIGTGHHHAAIEAAGPQQGWVEHVRTVGRGDQDDAFVGLKAIHFDEQLVQSLFALIVSAAEARVTLTAVRLDFVEEEDAGGILLALLEQVANPARSDADEHFNEVGTRKREERNIRLAGHSPGEQGLAGSGRPDQQYALR